MGSSGALAGPAQRAAGATRRPSIVLFLTDDQRWDTLWAMPHVRHLLMRHGVSFKNAFVVDPLCCPSRASTLTGNYAHTTGVYTNNGFARFDDQYTIATALHGAGYETGLFGKYLNGYDNTTYVPPGWSRWFAFEGHAESVGNYYNYAVVDDGRERPYGDAPSDYSTSVITRKAVNFVRSSSGPLLVYWAPSAPHRPAVPAPQDVDAFRGLEPIRPPNYNEANVADKPQWVRDLPPLTRWRAGQIDKLEKHQYQALLGIDRGVRDIVDALRDTGRLHHTVFVFTSDNGLAWGEHRWDNKLDAYEESIRVPLLIRYDPLTSRSRVDTHLALNIDLAPTLAQLAGVALPSTDGASLVPVLRRNQRGWRTNFLIEDGAAEPHHFVPKYCAVRSYGYLYVGYENGEEELYALRRDPYELTNRVRSNGLRDVRSHFRERLRILCDPPPPGYVVQH